MTRSEKEVLDATRPFAAEARWQSWGHVASTFAAIALAAAGTLRLESIVARLACGVTDGLLLVRGFILFHDFFHGAILRGSRLARALFWVYGLLVLTPAKVWRDTHNYHHAHNGKIVGSHIGSYPVVTLAMWRQMSTVQRLGYRAARHPATLALGVITVFSWGMCAAPFLRDRRRNLSAVAPLLLHAVLAVVTIRTCGVAAYAEVVAFPLALATSMGAYLFYAQHNFPSVFLQPRDGWSYVRAALESASYMPMGPLMAFLTGNIGYHHVHHLNPGIPFYRLPEAMRAIPELQHPRVTTLRLHDVVGCFRLDLWDPDAGRMVPLRAAQAEELERPSASPA